MEKANGIVKRIGRDLKEFAWAGIAFFVYSALTQMLGGVFCPFLQITGIPCAGCGLTRAFWYLFTGRFALAFSMQPMAFLILFFLLYCGFFRYGKGTKVRGFTPLLAALIGSMVIFWVVRMYLYFPDREPYMYWEDNVLSQIIPWYEEAVGKLLQRF